MGVAPSKTVESELRLTGRHCRPSPAVKQHSQQAASRSPLGSCPSSFALPKQAHNDPLKVVVGNDVDSKGTESSSGSPDLSGSEQGQRSGRWKSTSSSGSLNSAADPSASASGRAWLSWRSLSSSHQESKQAQALDHSAATGRFSNNHNTDTSTPPKMLILTTPRRDSGTRSVPVKCPDQQSHHHHHSTHVYHHEEEDSERLQQLYDMRTWHLYMRITEARKKQAAIQSHRIAQASAYPSDQSDTLIMGHHPLEEHHLLDANHNQDSHPFIFGELE